MAKNQKNTGGFPMLKIEFSNQFQELLKLDILHDFFSAGVFPKGKLSVKPTPATLGLLAENGLQFRALPSGCMLGYVSSNDYTPIAEITGPLLLSFFIELNDTKFYNYTDLPFEFEENKMFYFNNKAFEKESSDHKNLSLEQFVKKDDKIEISGPLISYVFEEEQFQTEVQIMNSLDEIVFEKILGDGSMSCDISLIEQPEGKYSLLIDGLEQKTFYLFKGLKPSFGVIDIYLDKDDFGDYAFFDDDQNLLKQEYNIRFGARAVRWQYLLIETGNDRMHNGHEAYDAFKGNSYEPIEFEAAQEAELESGKVIHTVWTKTPISFQEQQRQKFKLKTKRGKSGVEWIVELPCSSALNDLKINNSDKSEVYSELIVYL